MIRLRETVSKFIKRKSEEFAQYKHEGDLVSFKDIGGRAKHFYRREDWAFVPQHNHPEKVFLIEKLHFERVQGRPARRRDRKKGDIQYRICYYIVQRKGTKKGCWRWGQYCQLVPAQDMAKVLREIKRLRE